MTDDRDRRAAEEWWTHGLDLRDTTEACVESLAALLTAARAEGAARIKAAAKEAFEVLDGLHTEGCLCSNERCVARRILRDALEECP